MLLLLLCRGNGAAWSAARAALPKQSHEVLTRLGSLRPLAGSLLLWQVWQGQVGVLTTDANDTIRRGLAEVAALERGLGRRVLSQARSQSILTNGIVSAVSSPSADKLPEESSASVAHQTCRESQPRAQG